MIKKKTGVGGGPVDHIDSEINTYLWLLFTERSAAQERIDHFIKYIQDAYELPTNWIINTDGTITVPEIPQEMQQILGQALGGAQNNKSEKLQ